MHGEVFKNHDPRAPFRAQESLVLVRLGVLRHFVTGANEGAAALKLQNKVSPPEVRRRFWGLFLAFQVFTWILRLLV
jgi:hypothetical protein